MERAEEDGEAIGRDVERKGFISNVRWEGTWWWFPHMVSKQE